MDVFAPSSLTGVGLGSISSVAAIGGLVGVAVGSGMLLADGLLGALVFLAIGLAVLGAHHPAFAGAHAPIALVVLAVAVALALGGALWRRSQPGRARMLLVASAVLVGAGASGWVWADWSTRTLGLDTAGLVAGVVGLVAGFVGAAAAGQFVSGSLRSGGASAIVTGVTALIALGFDALSLFVPFAGYVVALLVATFAARSRRRAQRKYKGLRILA